MSLKLSFQNQVNAVGGLAFLIAGSFVVYELGRSRDAKSCGARYPVATQMSLQKSNGEPMSPAELQARVGIGERGIVEKANVITLTGAPAAVALEFKLGGPVATDTGAQFYWAANGIGKASSACISYGVYLPSDFDFGPGGKLPGLFGIGRGGNQRGFATRFKWDENGNMGVDAFLTDYDPANSLTQPVSYRADAQIPRGRWVQLDQEVTLNTPNLADGVLRLWIDGHLRLEDTKIGWRGNGALAIGGAIADVGYFVAPGPEGPAKKPSSVIVSPPQLSWN